MHCSTTKFLLLSPRFWLPVLLTLLLTACVTPGSRKAKAEDEDPEKDLKPGQLDVNAPLKAIRINPDYGWVVVRSPRMLAPGSIFSAWHGEEETARLEVDEQTRHPFYILEVIAGEPHPRDVYVPSEEARSPGARAPAPVAGPVSTQNQPDEPAAPIPPPPEDSMDIPEFSPEDVPDVIVVE